MHRLRAESGQAMVEFALILPLILTILLGVIEFGQAFNNKNDLTNMANQAMRYAEVNSCNACGTNSIETYIPTTADTGQLKGNTTVCFTSPNGTGAQAAGQQITVKVTAPFNWLSYLGLGASTTISTQVTGRLDVAYQGTGYQGTGTGDQYTLQTSC